MANYAILKAAIADVIKTNGTNAITGAILQSSLLSIIDSLGAGYQYVGIATPGANPGTPDFNVFYIAMSPGQYTGFGNLTLQVGEIAIFKYNGSWVKDSTNIPSADAINKVRATLNGVVDNPDLATNYMDIPTEINIGKYINPVNGNLATLASYTASDYIPVEGSTDFAFYGFVTLYAAWYDQNKNFISGIQYDATLPDGTVYQSPADAVYLRVSTQNASFPNSKIYVYSTEQPSLNPRIGITIPDSYTQQVKQYVNNQINKIANNIVDNIIILNELQNTIPNKYIEPSTGGESSLNGFTATDYISVEPSTKYVFNGFNRIYGAWYDSNKAYISGIQYDAQLPDGTEYESPANAAYIRVSTQTSAIPNAIFASKNITLSEFINLDPAQITPIVDERMDIIVPDITKGIFVLSELTGETTGKYVDPGSGNLGTLSGYTSSDYIPVLPSSTYAVYGFGKVYGAWYDENKNRVGGIQYDAEIHGVLEFTGPATAAYMRISTQSEYYANAAVALVNLYLSEYVKVRKAQVEGLGNLVQYVTITVKPSGGGDYTKLSDAFAAITDSSFDKRYIVEFYGDGTEYDTLLDKPFVDGQIGLTVPPFTKLVGIGGKSKNILVRRLQTSNQQDSLLNLNLTSELQGFTLIASNTRYVVHDDFYQQRELNTGFERKISDVECIGGPLYYTVVWGAGIRSGGNWVFENCIFRSENDAHNYSFTCHNNTGFSQPTHIKLVNCRFLTVTTGNKGCRFGTLNTNANGIDNLVNFYGCIIGGILLFEENASLYGSGILFHVSGFGNDLKTGDPNITITNTDGVDYSGNIDLI